MLSKFISVSETHFQNTETALKNQQASIQGLKTQIGQLSKLISERSQGSLPSNIEPSPREHLNAISAQNKDGLIIPEPKIQQNNAMNKRREEMSNSTKFLKELLSNKRKLDITSHVELNAVCSVILKNKLPNKLQDPGPPRTKATETVRYYHEKNKDAHEERRLQIEELDEWREHKPRAHDKPKLCKNKLDTSPNQLQVGDTVFLEAVDPHIVTTTPNEEIPLTVLSIFPFGTVEVSHPKFGTFKVNNTHLKPYFKTDNRNEEYELLKPP
ncbi:hypothetical protein GOBAR_AA10513 [Gossypium barbadense]|uniref:Uncharacterized protein n=1 Tax=Gossypium barbadense TaxID=3634 RepID=A0A2P5Y3M8_GOSBA|nr:hypothetical protein GOBAR_AA10513 [Gossypium barbadense]